MDLYDDYWKTCKKDHGCRVVVKALCDVLDGMNADDLVSVTGMSRSRAEQIMAVFESVSNLGIW